LLAAILFPAHAALAHARATTGAGRSASANTDIAGTVTDSTNGQPLESAEVSVRNQSGSTVSRATTDGFGRFTVHNLPEGRYSLLVHFVGYRPLTRPITVGSTNGPLRVTFAMTPVTQTLEAMQVNASVPISVDTHTGDQIFQQTEFHGAPTVTPTQILQQSIVGAARAPTGEVHVRGQHAEYTYVVDGVPIPSGISGSLNELFDPEVVNAITFQTGGWDAQYGNKNAAIVNVTTKIPSGGFHATASSFVGDYDHSATAGPTGFNGQSLSLSGNNGPWGMYVAGSRQFSDMRREPVVFDTTAARILNFHNSGTDEFGFLKLQYSPASSNVVSLDANLGQTRFAVPFDSSGGVQLDDHQRDVNSFVNLGWRHQIGAQASGAGSSELFTGLFFRHGSLSYDPGLSDHPVFVFYPDTTPRNLSERRSFNAYGVTADYTLRPREEVELKFGTTSSITRGHEDFNTFDAQGRPGPTSNSDLTGSDVGVYGQTVYSPVEQVEIRTGVRYDAHTAPFAGTQTQVSPRVRLNFYPFPSTTLYAYYGRMFIPTNVEDLRSITSVSQQGVAAQPTLPERDNFYEAGLIQRLPDASINVKLSAYHKDSSPGIDDNTVPGSNIVTSVNISQVKVTGLEGVVEYRPNGPFSAYANAALAHAYGEGPITGGFFPAQTPQGFFDLDHDQRLSIVGNASYSPSRFFLSGTVTYGSGLTNGVDPSACNCSYGTGLSAFNSGVKVASSTVYSATTGYTFNVGTSVFQPQLFVDNLFDKKYLLKGAFFSGASVGRPRSIQLRVKVAY
jgi:hypothetical protein